MTKVSIAGDFAPLDRALSHFRNGDGRVFFNQLHSKWHDSDVRILNLEAPIIEREAPIVKHGPHLGIPGDSADSLKEVSLVTLANNHIMDHGSGGLGHTLSCLKDAHVGHTGAGLNVDEASKGHISAVGSETVGVLAWGDKEFSVASFDQAGIFPVDLISGIPALEAFKEQVDYLVLILHMGPLYSGLPSPGLRRLCRFLATRGVDAIVCQHSHCLGAVEWCGGCPIIYGQGSLIFDKNEKRADWAWTHGVIVHLEFQKGERPELELLAIKHSTRDCVFPVALDDDEAKRVLDRVAQLSATLSAPALYQDAWMKHASARAQGLLPTLVPGGVFFHKIARKLGLPMRKYLDARLLLTLLNAIECESNQCLVTTCLRDELGLPPNYEDQEGFRL